MRPLTQEWLDKAAADYRSMHREYRVTEDPNYNDVCFHDQQCVEKSLKAFLHTHHIYFPKTHDISEILRLTLPVHPEWEALIKPNAFLTDFAADTRYPGESAFKEEADKAVVACENIRKIVLSAFDDLDQHRLV